MTPERRLLSAGYNNNNLVVEKIFLYLRDRDRRRADCVEDARRSVPTVAHPSPVSKKGREKKKKLVLHLWGILNSLSVPFALPPLSPGIHGAPVHFHARPLHFLTSSRLTCLVEKRARLVETARSSVGSHVGKGGGELKLEPSPPLPPHPPVPAQPAPSFFSMLDPRPVKEEVATKKGA